MSNQYAHYSQCKKCGTPIKNIYEFAGNHYGSKCIEKVLGYDVTRYAEEYNTRDVDKIIKLKEKSDKEIQASIEANYQKQKSASEHLFKSDFVGDVGDKVEVSATIETIFGFRGTYGWTNVVKFVDSEGNLFISFSSAKFLDNVHEGDEVALSGVVKNHNEEDIRNYTAKNRDLTPDEWVLDRMDLGYDIKETQLSRIKLVEGK